MTRDTKINGFLPGYKKLIVWQVADELAKEIYRISLNFPKTELYNLTSQSRRASLSVVLNIIEGYSRNNKNEFRQFLRIALGSIAETKYLVEFSLEQKFLQEAEFDNLSELCDRCGSMLWKLYKSQG